MLVGGRGKQDGISRGGANRLSVEREGLTGF